MLKRPWLEARLDDVLAGEKMKSEWCEYDEEADVLDVYFGERRPAWTIELTPNILLSVDRSVPEVVSLTFLDYTALMRPTDWGLPNFPITELAGLPATERIMVVKILNTPPVNHWLDVSIVRQLPDSPFVVTHLLQTSAKFHQAQLG